MLIFMRIVRSERNIAAGTTYFDLVGSSMDSYNPAASITFEIPFEFPLTDVPHVGNCAASLIG